MSAFDLSRNGRGRLVFTDRKSGRSEEGVVPVRAFPIAAPDAGISLLSSEGHELAWIDTLDALAAPLRTLIEEELASREFLPEILHIRAVSGVTMHSAWEVETDRGPTTFTLRGEEDIRRIGKGALLITDSHGVQYLVRDLQALDKASRKVLDRFM